MGIGKRTFKRLRRHLRFGRRRHLLHGAHLRQSGELLDVLAEAGRRRRRLLRGCRRSAGCCGWSRRLIHRWRHWQQSAQWFIAVTVRIRTQQRQSVCKTSVMASLFQSKLFIKRILSALTPIKVAMYIKTVQCSNQVHCDMLFPYYYTFNFHLFSQLYRAEDNLYCAQIK